MAQEKQHGKHHIKASLFLWDTLTFIMVFFSIFMMFEIAIKNIIITSNVDNYYENLSVGELDMLNAFNFLEEKKNLSYEKYTDEILTYIKDASLKRSRYDLSLALLITGDEVTPETIIYGTRIGKDYTIAEGDIDIKRFKTFATGIPETFKAEEFDNILAGYDETNKNILLAFYTKDAQGKTYHLSNIPGKRDRDVLCRLMYVTEYEPDRKRSIRFKINGVKYIGIAEYAPVGLKKAGRTDREYPVIVLADREKDFFYLMNRIRNIFMFMLFIIFLVVMLIKILTTKRITDEIDTIRKIIAEESSYIEEKGVVGIALKEITLDFMETDNLYLSYSDLSKRLIHVGNIISGIADRELFRAVLKQDNTLLIPHEEMMTIMFLDIKGFTTLAEDYKEKVIDIVNDIWLEVEKVVARYTGKINKYMGDACLIIFPDNLTPGTSSTEEAVRAAIDILLTVGAVKERLEVTFDFRIGIDYGKVVYGKTGTNNNYELGVIGDPVNTASRFENLNKQYNTKVLLTGKALSNTGYNPDETCTPSGADNYRFFLIDKARPKGKQEVTNIYTLLREDHAGYSFPGEEELFAPADLTHFTTLLQEFLHDIGHWRHYLNAKKTASGDVDVLYKKAYTVWSTMALKFARFYHEKRFPCTLIFIKKLISQDEFREYITAPAKWLDKKYYKIEQPGEDWITNGFIELDK